MSTSGGCRSCRARSACGVSPERTATVILGISAPIRRATRSIPASGARRLCSTSTPNALSGEIYSTFTPPVSGARCAAPTGSDSWPARSTKLFSAHKKAARVLPEPVGATIRAWLPAEISVHACSCTAVGAANTSSNQPRTCGLNNAKADSVMLAIIARAPERAGYPGAQRWPTAGPPFGGPRRPTAGPAFWNPKRYDETYDARAF